MDWSVIFTLIAFAAVLQLAFFWYYFRSGQQTESPYPTATGDHSETSARRSANQPAGDQSPSTDDGVTCETCGYHNEWDSMYTYCANCTTQLG